jgi:hypothetical protein
MGKISLRRQAGLNNERKMKRHKENDQAANIPAEIDIVEVTDNNLYHLRSQGSVDINNNTIVSLNMHPENEKGCQTSIKYVHQSTQTDFDLNSNLSNYKTSVSSKVSLVIIALLLDMFRVHVNGWNSIHERVLSVIIYMIFKLHSVKYEQISEILYSLNCLNIKHAAKWCQSIIENNDLECVFEDHRGI